MAFFTLSAGELLFDVLEGSLALGLDGAPVATLELPEAAEPPLGPADILVAKDGAEPVRFVGTLTFARAVEGRCSVTWVGGAGGLGGGSTELHYTTITKPVALADVVIAIVAAAGEQIVDPTLAELAGLTLPRWTRIAGETWGKALSRALEGTGRTWRILDTGLVWIGAETWPEVDLGGTVLDEGKVDRTVTLTLDTATARPGTTHEGRHVVGVTFFSEGHALLELYDAASGLAGFARLLAIAPAKAKTDPYARIYRAKVVAQNADQTLDLELVKDDGADWFPLPFTELTKVPFDSGVQGARYVLPQGSIVRVIFVHASPAGAIAFGRPTSVIAARGVARLNDQCDAGTLSILGAGGLVLTYTDPFGVQSNGAVTGAAGLTPVVFAGSFTAQIKAKIVTASEEVFLQ